MLIDRLNLKLVNIECMPTSIKFNAIIDLEVDIGDLLPYLASAMDALTSTAQVSSATWTRATSLLSDQGRSQ